MPTPANLATRAGTLALFIIVRFGAIALCYRWRVLRFALLGVTLLASSLLALLSK